MKIPRIFKNLIGNKKILVVAASVLILLIASAIIIPLAVMDTQTTKIAFYGLDENIQNAIEDEISRINLKRVKFYQLDGALELPKDVQKQYSILFAKNSLNIKQSQDEFIPVKENIIEALPTSIRKSTANDGKHYGLPLLLDHFEMSYYRTYRNNARLEIPRTYGDLLNYLRKIKEQADIPLICAGADDRNLLAFTSVIAESFYGADDYKKLADVCRDSLRLNKANLPEMLTRVLDEIKEMQKQELLFPQWTKTQIRDIHFFMSEHKLGSVAIFLSDHRKVEFNLIKYYDSSIFPRYNMNADHGVIAPVTAAFLLKPRREASLVLGQLVSNDAQTNLSNISLLAPAAARAESVDIQADDVRFWAASCSAGPLASLADECEISEERRHTFAEKVRIYLNY